MHTTPTRNASFGNSHLFHSLICGPVRVSTGCTTVRVSTACTCTRSSQYGTCTTVQIELQYELVLRYYRYYIASIEYQQQYNCSTSIRQLHTGTGPTTAVQLYLASTPVAITCTLGLANDSHQILDYSSHLIPLWNVLLFSFHSFSYYTNYSRALQPSSRPSIYNI